MTKHELLDVRQSWLQSTSARRFSAVAAFARAKPLGAVCGALLVIIVLAALFARQLAPHDPGVHDALARLAGPGHAHWLGTDQFGRDVFSRILVGARTSIQVVVTATSVSLVVSLTLGVTSAYFRGSWDFVVGRLVDAVQALPAIIVLVALIIVFGRSIVSIGIALGASGGLIGSRVTRSAALAVGAQPFVEVARATGCSPMRVMLKHIIPNIIPLVIVVATVNIGTVIIAEASLGFLGYGVPPPAPSWGNMLSAEGRLYMIVAPWLFYAPTFALALVVFSSNMFGDALRDKLDPRLRGG